MAQEMFNNTAEDPSPWKNNSSNFEETLKNIPIDANLAWLVFSLLIAMVWVIYITHYNARVLGQILTRICNHFIGSGYIRIGTGTLFSPEQSSNWMKYFNLLIPGSLAIDPLAGKIMFRDIMYCTEDFSVGVQDGWIVFRWWRAYVPRDISEGLSSCCE